MITVLLRWEACGGLYAVSDSSETCFSREFIGTQQRKRPWPRDSQEDNSTADARESFISLALGHWSRYCLASAQNGSSLSHQSSCTEQLINGAILKSEREWFMNVFLAGVTPKWTGIAAKRVVTFPARTQHTKNLIRMILYETGTGRRPRGLQTDVLETWHTGWMLIPWFNCFSLSFGWTVSLINNA